MRVKIEKSKATGIVKAPPSKSMSHRMLICSGLCEGESVVRGISFSEDVLATLDCLESLGAKYRIDGDCVYIKGINPFDIKKDVDLFCRESGSTMRFFVPICLTGKRKSKLYGSRTLLKRPMSVYEDICREQELGFECFDDHMEISGKLKSGNYKVKGNISSQFISGLLFIMPLLDGDSTINITPPIESSSYINLTIDALKTFGVEVVWSDERTLYIKGNQRYKTSDVTVEGDYSNSAFFASLSYLGSDVKVVGLNPESLQGDKVYDKYFDMLSRGTPTIHISDCPDLGPVLFALAACKNGAIFTGTARLKIKESDRAKAMATELEKFGISVRVDEDSVVVYPGDFYPPKEALCGHNDHRIVMSLAVMLTTCGGTIEGSEAVSKSFPDFFDILEKTGIKVTQYADN
ncbi:MAG: 3-phosphoshikimate 1-carboxyvinyltransferase [Ruminococcaceae bacterium]|nr:3-phosphoshikimate 1-carboxyvinyltransferase [Oscillospiraceae bacterium]